MLRNLLLTAWRSLIKNKFFSALNIVGLATGMAVYFLITQYVRFEKSYEAFVPNAENTYRVTLETYLNNELAFASAENYPGVGPTLKNELPEVVSYARLYNLGYKNNVIITNEEATPDAIAFKHRRFLYADSAFLSMMGYPLVRGDEATALASPNTAVISETYARMYFGTEDPIGKMLRLQDDDYNNELVKVTGVFEDVPDNTHLKFDVLFSYKTLFGRLPERGNWAIQRYDQGWNRKDMYVFVSLRPGTDAKSVEAKFPTIIEKYNPGLKERNQRDVLSLQPLKSIHLTSQLAEEPEPNGDQRIVNFLGIIGMFVLVIAWFNYINLSTAKAMERAKEVGIRKVMGAFKGQLISQFLSEAAIVNFFSLLLAVTIMIAVLPVFNSLSGLSLNIVDLFSTWFIGLMGAIWIVGSLLSGFYPALVLSSFKPVVVLKGKMKNSLRGILLRKSLVVLQFMASVALIAGTLIIYRQLNYMMNQDIGMNIDQVLVVERPGISPRDRQAFNSSVDVFRTELKRNGSITGVASSVTIPGKQREYKAGVKKYGAPDDQLLAVRFNSMDYDFIDVFKMKLVAGRGFSPDFPKDQDTSVVISESAAKLLGFVKPEDAIGQTVDVPDFQFRPIIVGVVNDYHQVSLKRAMDPTIFYCSPYYGEFYSIRIQTNNLNQTLDHVKACWEKAFPGNPIDYFYLDDFFNQQYENERKFGKLFTSFAVLAVIIGCLGLFGLSAYTAMQRTKEIGIRKVVGSSDRSIYLLLSQEYLKLIVLSILLASPIVWWFMNGWLQGFSYRMPMGVDVFLIAGIAVLLVSLITISYQTLKAIRVNPADSLRQE